ncbi:MAG: DMT family transporter [Tenacibaculum sp.]
MSSRVLAFTATSFAAVIYGLNFSIAKDVMPLYIKPFGFIALRVVGASCFFWLIGLFLKNQKIEKQDYKLIFAASFFGIALNMLTFFKGLSYTSPINASVIMITSPILVLVFSSILLKEKLFFRKIAGIIIGMSGALVLILYGKGNGGDSKNIALGNLLVFINATSYALYLVIVRNIIQKYNPILFVKWLYFFGFLLVLPFGAAELLEVKWHLIPTAIYLKAGFVTLFATCFTYLFNLFALSILKPTTVSVFIYLQPVIATIYALLVGSDSLSIVKVIAVLLIFLGVYLATKQSPTTTNK